MKKLITTTLAFGSMALLMLVSCNKSDQLVTLSSTSTTASTLTASTTTPALSKATLTTTAVTFTGTAPSYGYNAAVTNTLQFDVHGGNFVTPKKEVVLSVGALSQAYNVQDFNNILLAMSLKTGVASQIDVRVKSSLSATTGIVYSNVVTLTVTPFALTSYLYAVGQFQTPSMWNAASPDSLVSATGNGVYVGIFNFTAGNNQFLILPQKNSYNNKYATNDPTSGTSSTVTQNANNNFYAPSGPGNPPGQYLVTLNLNTNTISFALANYYSVIGSNTPGGNYSTDIDFTKYVNDVNGYWTGTFALTAGAFKIREDHDWTWSWGDTSPADGKDATDNNGANINTAAAGNYVITFTIPPTAIAPGFVPSVTATYTVK